MGRSCVSRTKYVARKGFKLLLDASNVIIILSVRVKSSKRMGDLEKKKKSRHQPPLTQRTVWTNLFSFFFFCYRNVYLLMT